MQNGRTSPKKQKIEVPAGKGKVGSAMAHKEAAFSSQYSALISSSGHPLSQSGRLRPSADRVWDWVALGWPLGHPSVAQGPRLGLARVELDKCFALNAAEEKAGWGGKTEGNPKKPLPQRTRRVTEENLKPMRNEAKTLKSTPIWDDLR
jgi:hypothetical protein